ncbi:MAG: sigma-70 family RNA polymerase sigma factor [Phycisphaerales bacterium]
MLNYSSKLELFEQLRTRNAKFLENVLWKLTGDRELFADSMQNALTKMWQHIDKFKGTADNAYLYRIAQSSASIAWRNRLKTKDCVNVESIDPAEIPEDKVCNDDTARQVRCAITALPDKQAKALMMRYLEQKDYQSISKELKCTEAAVRSNVSKALETLRRKLNHE